MADNLQLDLFRTSEQGGRAPQLESRRRIELRRVIEQLYVHWEHEEKKYFHSCDDRSRCSCKEQESILSLAELQLSTIPPSTVTKYASNLRRPHTTWVYEQYCSYAVRIRDYGPQGHLHHLPLVELTATPNHRNALELIKSGGEQVSRLLPRRPATCRLIAFPQTRYSFIEDKALHGIYPFAEEEVDMMSHTLRRIFHGSPGFYNTFPNPIAASVSQITDAGEPCQIFASVYPVMYLENVQDFTIRKGFEKRVKEIQAKETDATEFPFISKPRYLRRFDLKDESRQSANLGLQSGRGLYEYSCGELDTVDLDVKQTSIVHYNQPELSSTTYLIQVAPLWLLAFPTHDTVCAFWNTESQLDPFQDVLKSQKASMSWDKLSLRIIRQVDSMLDDYQARYRTTLAKLQFSVFKYKYDKKNHSLHKELSGVVAELSILIDLMQSQITVLEKWKEWSPIDIDDIVSTKLATIQSLSRLQAQAREAQSLLFQLANVETAQYQAELADRMAKDTYQQIEMGRHAARQNRAILVFTIVTVIFLPLSFFTSYFGMNTEDIREFNRGQGFFWAIAAPISAIVIGIAVILAYNIKRWKRRGSVSSTQRQHAEKYPEV